MTRKSTLDRRRESGFALEIKSRGQSSSAAITSMMKIHDQMLVLKEDGIFQIVTPDEIDPQRLHPHTKGGTRKLFEIGTSHPVVARTIIQAQRLLESVVFSHPIHKEDIMNKYFQYFKELYACNTIYNRFVNRFIEETQQIQLVLELSNDSQFVGDIPQIQNLEEDTKAFFLTARKALIELSSLTDIFFPDKLKRNNPHRPQNFDQISRWLSDNLRENSDLHQMIQDDLCWIVILWEIRNAVEHRDNPDYSFEVRNIELGPNRKFYGPRWRYSCPKYKQEDLTDLLYDIESYMNNILSFGEELLVFCIKKHGALVSRLC